MKIIKLVTFAAAMTATAQLGMAQVEPQPAPQTVHVWEDPRGWWGNHFVYDVKVPEKFTANEFSFDLFASYTAAESQLSEIFETDIDDGNWGGGRRHQLLSDSHDRYRR